VTLGDDPSRSGGSPSATGRFARWLAGWRVAIRIARRDARRYKWRSALIVAMVGLPVLLLTSGITLLATNDISTAESVPRIMGSAEARISYNGIGRLAQSPEGRSISNDSDGDGEATNALAVPGFELDSAWTANKVEQLTGGRVIGTTNAGMRVTLGDRRPMMPVLGIDGRDPLARGMTDLVSGRWASTPSEIVVTQAGIANGLPSGGTLTTAGPDGKPRQLTVVGVATGHTDYGQLPFLVAQPALVADVSDQQAEASAFLVERADSVTWSDVRTMNNYGLLVQSRQVFLNPPSANELDPKVAQTVVSYQNGNDLVLLIAAIGLFIETTLLAGPAFAVSAARQRRSLALAASNGAEARQLRRYVLGQAVVLGFVSAAVAVVAGVLLTLAGLTWWQAGHADFATGPFEVSWPRVVGVFLCAIVASMVAALLPAKSIARLDIVSVLAGRSADRAVHRGLPVAGVIVMVQSGTAIFWSVASGAEGGQGRSEYVVAGGAVVLVVGALMVIPALLAFVGMLGTHLVLPLRLATRDTARQRGRSTPAVAAIMATVAALTALSIGAASDTRQRQLEYQAQLAMGHGRVVLMSGQDDKAVRSTFRTYAPDLALYEVGSVGDPDSKPGSTLEMVSAKPAGCSDAAVFGAFGTTGGPVDERCVRLGAGSMYQQAQIQVVSIETLTATIPVSDAERRVLRDGGVLVFDPSLGHGGYVEFVKGRTKVGTGEASTVMPVVTGHQKVPALVIDRQAWSSVLHDQLGGAWVLPETAAKLGWPVTPSHLEVTSPTGVISAATETALNEHLDTENTIYVERGFQNDSWLILLILFCVAGLLVLIASLISTALSLAESQNDMATLAAVGATRHTRRGIAGCQALVVAASGCLLGVAVGMIPGIAITWPLTTQGFDPVTSQQITQAPIIVIPWLHLVAVCVAVPLLAGALAWLAVRRHPQMTRRLA
jgi:putative ABC transport system permease protein